MHISWASLLIRFWDPISKKVIRSQDVVFFEEHTIEDIDKSSHSKSPSITRVHPNPVFPDPFPQTNGGDTKEDDDNNDEDGDDPPEQPPIPTESKLRRSTRVLDRDNLHRHIPLVIMYFLLMGEG